MPQPGGFMPPVRYTACMKPAVQPGDFALREGGSISSPGIHFNADKPPTKCRYSADKFSARALQTCLLKSANHA
jgi:hypothetical protein